MYVVNQDRDQIVEYDVTSILSYIPVIYKNVLMGFNLLIDDNAVGTFGSVHEATKEILVIMNCKEDYYLVSGFSNWNALVKDWRDDNEVD